MRCVVSRPDRADPGAGLDVRDLQVRIGGLSLVRGVDLRVRPGEAVGLVGESGSGKSLTIKAIMRLLSRRAVTTGQVLLDGQDLLLLDEPAMRRVRGSRVAMVHQDPMSSLNPLLPVGRAVAQVVRAHADVSSREAGLRAVELLERVGIDDAARRARSYPHQFSGGMRQRVVIAMALASRPSVLLADEPTTALDVVVQAGILALLDDLRRDEQMAVVLVSHDFAVVSGVCDRVGVMYAGEMVEVATARDVLFAPRHPYTRGLLDSHPEGHARGLLRPVPGAPPEPGQLGVGCPFAPRCPRVQPDCTQQDVLLAPDGPERLLRCLHPVPVQEQAGAVTGG